MNYKLLGKIPARLMSQNSILMKISDSVESGCQCEAAGVGSARKECTAGVSPNNSEDKIIILFLVI